MPLPQPQHHEQGLQGGCPSFWKGGANKDGSPAGIAHATKAGVDAIQQ